MVINNTSAVEVRIHEVFAAFKSSAKTGMDNMEIIIARMP
jgi:hypothetical protein